jgi:hypothetical protein
MPQCNAEHAPVRFCVRDSEHYGKHVDFKGETWRDPVPPRERHKHNATLTKSGFDCSCGLKASFVDAPDGFAETVAREHAAYVEAAGGDNA